MTLARAVPLVVGQNHIIRRRGADRSLNAAEIEFGLQTWLQYAGGFSPADATAAAAGWGGDRVVLAAHGDAFAIAIQTLWDSAADAAAFAAAADITRGRLPGSTALIDPGATNRVTVFIASDASAISRLAGALGLAG